MKVGFSFITYAVKKRGIEFCWQCPDHEACDKWHKHREFERSHDSLVCYQRLEENIAFIENQGIFAFEADQKKREYLLSEMLAEFNEGLSKSFYCIASLILDTQENCASNRPGRRYIRRSRDRDQAIKSESVDY